MMGEVEMRAFEKLSEQNYKRWLIPLVDDVLVKGGGGNTSILDVGCGPGLLAKEFALRSQKFFVTGVDVSRAAVRMAKKNSKGLLNTSFTVGNVNKLPFRDGSFDVIVCKDTLHHFNDPHRALKEMLRVTKGDGMVYIQDLRRDVPWYLLKRVVPPKNVVEKLIYYSTRAAYTKGEVKKLLEAFPVKNLNVKTRIVTREVRERYKRHGIDMAKLREAFVSRYVTTVRKQS